MSQTEITSPTPIRRLPSRWLIALGLFGILALVVGGAAFQGYQAGQSKRNAEALATQTADLRMQYDLGMGDLAAGRYTVAAARFEYILKIDPAYPGAAEKLAEARQALRVTTTPPPAVTPTLLATSGDAQALFALAQQAHTAGDWEGAIAYLASLHALAPDYEAAAVERMLYEALRNRGVARIQGDEMELGITDLDHAEEFAPLDEEAANHRRWAKSYLAAQSYWGVNWEQTVLILQELYLIAPYFKDTAPKLYQATLNYASQLAAAGDYCAAAQQYAAAQTLSADSTTAEAQATAQAACALTPTPDLSATPSDQTATPTDEATPTPAP